MTTTYTNGRAPSLADRAAPATSNGHHKGRSWSTQSRIRSRASSLQRFAGELAAEAARLRREAMAIEDQAIHVLEVSGQLERVGGGL